MPQQAGLGEDEEEEKGKQTQGREALCLGVLSSAGGLGGAQRRRRAAKPCRWRVQGALRWVIQLFQQGQKQQGSSKEEPEELCGP